MELMADAHRATRSSLRLRSASARYWLNAGDKNGKKQKKWWVESRRLAESVGSAQGYEGLFEMAARPVCWHSSWYLRVVSRVRRFILQSSEALRPWPQAEEQGVEGVEAQAGVEQQGVERQRVQKWVPEWIPERARARIFPHSLYDDRVATSLYPFRVFCSGFQIHCFLLDARQSAAAVLR